MSDDPETVRQIAELSRDERPLLVVDVDEVVLDFVHPLIRYLNSQGLHLRTDSFRLHGNVVRSDTGIEVEHDEVKALLTGFFDVQGDWQTAATGAVETLAALSQEAEIVMLSAMPHRHRVIRRALLDRLELPYPLVSTETPKGPAVRMLRGDTARPVVFVDDIPRNLESVGDAVPDASLFHLMAHAELRVLLMPLPDRIQPLENWADGRVRIAAALGI